MVTTLDYSPLSSAVTRKDVAAFRREFPGTAPTGSQTSVVVIVLITVAGALALSTILNVFSLVFSQASGPRVILATMIIAAIVFAAIGFLGSHVRWKRLVRLTRFAQANGLVLAADGVMPPYPGAIFGVGSARRVPEHFTRAAKPSVDFGNLDYTTGSGKNRKVHHWGYLAIRLDRMLPQMVLDAKSNNFLGTNLPTKFSRGQILPLEGDFDRYFTLYCPREYERDALYVFTPDLMARLIDEAAMFDVEIVDDWMFLYSSRPFDLTDPATVGRIFRIVDTVGSKTAERTERYADDRVAAGIPQASGSMHFGARMASNTVSAQGRRLKRGVPIAGVIVAVVVVAVWLINYFPLVVQLR